MSSPSTDPAARPANVDVTVNGRYQLTRWVRRTVLADEYLADDLLLGRVVVFKALLPELVSDKAFVDRFRAQAQAGANLNHPAINAVLDWGRDPGPIPDGRGGMRPGPTYYLVAENPEGRTLTDLIEANGPMPVERAAHVIIATTAALGFAHRAGSVHGGLTPDQIRVSSSGVVKVMDLGLTRALGASWVPADTNVDAAAWLAPEQFRGEGPSEKTDVYQVGLISYFLATGRRPYAGESVEVIRDRHLTQVPLAPTKINPGLPKPFEAFIGRSMAKNPDDRYGSVIEQRSAMVRVRERLAAARAGGDAAPTAAAPAVIDDATVAAPAAPATPLAPRSRPTDAAALLPDGDETVAVSSLGTATHAAPLRIDDATRVVASGAATLPDPDAAGDDRTQVAPRSKKGRGDDAKGPVRGDGALPDGPEQDWAALEKPARRWPYVTALVVLLAILGGLVFLLYRQLAVNDNTGTVTVPSLQGRPLTEAQAALREVGLRYEVQRENSATLAADQIIDQSPKAGVKVSEGSLVTMRVSTGSTKPTVPNVVGMTTDQAKSNLASFGLAMAVQEVKDDSVDAGTIVSQEPKAEAEVDKGATVTVQVAVSSGTKQVPKVDKLSQEEARAALQKEGFLIVVQSEPSNDVDKGLVIRTEPAGGTSVAKGSSVVIITSGGKVVAVPSVIGKDQASATAALEGVGLTVTAKERIVTDPTQQGKVIAQTPAEGANAQLNDTVTIRIGVLDTSSTTKATTAPSTDAGVPAPSTAPLQTVPTTPVTVAPTAAPVTTAAPAPAPAPAPVPAAGATTPTTAVSVVVVAPSSTP